MTKFNKNYPCGNCKSWKHWNWIVNQLNQQIPPLLFFTRPLRFIIQHQKIVPDYDFQSKKKGFYFIRCFTCRWSFWINKTVEWKPILTVNYEGIWSLTFVRELIWGIHDNWTRLYWIVLVISMMYFEFKLCRSSNGGDRNI